MKVNKDQYSNGFYKLNNQDYLDNQRIAGKILVKALKTLDKLVKDRKTKSLIELDKIAESIIIDSGGIPTFKGHEGFPTATCIAVNDQLVHGIPSDYILKDGDLVTFDLGVTYNKSITDSAITCIFGKSKYSNLVEITRGALTAAINVVEVGKRIGCIGDAINKYVGGRYNIITHYGGHCINYDLHSEPFISNKDNINNGIRIQPGMVIAIEPMLTTGSSNTWVNKDNWSVYTNGISAHFEHTIFVHKDKVEIITDFNNED